MNIIPIRTYKAQAIKSYLQPVTKQTVDIDEIVTVKQPTGQQIVTIIKEDGTKIVLGWPAFCYNFREIEE